MRFHWPVSPEPLGKCPDSLVKIAHTCRLQQDGDGVDGSNRPELHELRTVPKEEETSRTADT